MVCFGCVGGEFVVVGYPVRRGTEVPCDDMSTLSPYCGSLGDAAMEPGGCVCICVCVCVWGGGREGAWGSVR